MTAGLDIGNGYIKGVADIHIGETSKNVKIDLPSCVASVASPMDMPPTSVESVIQHLFDQASLSFNTPLVKGLLATSRAYLGRRAIESGQPIIAFDINNKKSKAEQELSTVLILSLIASAALQTYFEANKALPENTLKVECCAGLALPIDEYRKFREVFANNLYKHKHFVSFYNFEQPVNVELSFPSVKVIAEGASAIYAMKLKGEKFMDVVLNEVRQNGIPLDGITAADILNAEGVLGIDIGEGTVNFPVFTSGMFNTDSSGTLGKGYGTILESSLEPLAVQSNGFGNRKTLAEFLQKTPSNLSRNRYDKTRAVVDSQSVAFCHEIVDTFTKLLHKADGQIEVIYVYGGGASSLKQWLYPLLIDASRDFAAGSDFPILYLDSKYSRYLNREGLFDVASAGVIKA
jgi:plasmid segregation protein ParM